jgi:hypothetical protein
MLTSTWKQRACVLLALVLGVRPAAAQRVLSPAARQTLGALLASVPPFEQRLVLNAVRALGPARAEQQLGQLQAIPAASRAAGGQLVTQILLALPPQYQQVFVDGLFEVSAPEAQFVVQVVNYIRQQMAQQADATQMIAEFGQFGRTLQSQAWQQRQDLLGQQAEGMMGTLGPFTQYVAPSSGWQGDGYTAPVGMQMYKCPASDWPVPSPTPLVGCVPAYAR